MQPSTVRKDDLFILLYIYIPIQYIPIHIYIYTYLYMFTPSMSPPKVFEMFAETGRELSTSTALVSRPCQRLAWLGLLSYANFKALGTGQEKF